MIGLCPASARYLAVDRPARPAPAMAMVRGRAGLGALRHAAERAAASLLVVSFSKSGLGKSLAIMVRGDDEQRRVVESGAEGLEVGLCGRGAPRMDDLNELTPSVFMAVRFISMWVSFQ